MLTSYKPTSTQDYGQGQEQSEAAPGQTVQGCFCAAGAAEHGAAASRQATHAVTFGTMQQHQDDQQKAGADPAPGQN